MPSYEFECDGGHRTTVFCRIAERDRPVLCSDCGNATIRVYSLAAVQTLEEYVDHELGDEGTDKPFVVTSKRQKERRMRELDLDCVPMSERARDRMTKGTIFSIPRGR